MMKGIKLCAECAFYSMKKHKCTAGATDEGKATDKFYADCPLHDVYPIVYCRDCINYNTMGCSNGFGWCEAWQQGRADESFCDCGERK